MLCIFLNIKSDWRICIIPTSVDSSQQTRGSYEAQTIARPVLKLRLTQEKGSQIDNLRCDRLYKGHNGPTAQLSNRLSIVLPNLPMEKMPGTMVVGPDLEFSPISDTVLEVGLCEYYSGKKLLNARIKRDCRESELHKPLDGFKQTNSSCQERHLNKGKQ